MDYEPPLPPEESYTLSTISRHDEVQHWLSPEVNMHIIRTIAGGYGTVYCVRPQREICLRLTVVTQKGHSRGTYG